MSQILHEKADQQSARSTDAQIKTGLSLSEAIKLLEDNPGALIKENNSVYLFQHISLVSFKDNHLYDVKLPPPKSVTVTRAMVIDAFYKSDIVLTEGTYEEAKNRLCKELGL